MNLPTLAQFQAAFVAWFNSLVGRPDQFPSNEPTPGITSTGPLTLAEIQTVLGVPAESGVYSYKALLTQTGTDDPTATVLENTFPGDTASNVALNRSSPGNYQITFPQASGIDKIAVVIGSVDGAGDQGAQALVVLENTIALATFVPSTLAQVDDVLSNTLVHLQVYP